MSKQPAIALDASKGRNLVQGSHMATTMSLFPKEHGAYGQITVPLITAFLAAGVSTTGLLIATSMLAGFLAHEPALVLIGARGARAKRDLRQRAIRWLGCTLTVGVAAAVGVVATL